MKLAMLTALHCEAKPFIEALDLKKEESIKHFLCYRNEECVLLISGIGIMASCAATVFLTSLIEEPESTFFVNVGTAGHHNLPLSTLCFCHKISYHNLKTLYPYIPPSLSLPSFELISLPKPQAPSPSHLIDMEGYGFFSAASKLLCIEQLAVLKIVSDNTTQSYENLTKEKISQLMASQVPHVMTFLQSVFPKKYPTPSTPILTFPSTYTFSQQDILKKKWKQLHALKPKISPPCFHASFNEELKALEKQHLNILQESL